MILRVGLTGGLASGKSTVTRVLEDLGCSVIDADAIVSELYRPGEKGWQRIVEHYGQEMLRPDGSIDRTRLAAHALSSNEAAEVLNGMIHPLVAERVEELLLEVEQASGSGNRIAVVEATLLMESGMAARYHRVVVVDLEPATQLARAEARGMPRDEALRRMARQMPREQRLAGADYVIDTSGDLATTASRTRLVHEQLLADLARLSLSTD